MSALLWLPLYLLLLLLAVPVAVLLVQALMAFRRGAPASP